MNSPDAKLATETQPVIHIRRIAFGYAWTLGSRVLSLTLGALAAVLIPRWLGPEEYGRFSWIISIASFFLVFADFGVSPSVARYVTQYQVRDPGSAPQVIRDGLRLLLAFSGLFALVNWFAAPWLVGRFAGETLLWPLRFASFYIVAMSLHDFVAMTLQGLQRLDLMAVVSLLGSVTKTLLSIGLVYTGLGVSGAVVGQVVGIGLAVVLGRALVRHSVRDRVSRRVRQHSFSRQIFIYGIPMMLIGVSFYIYTQSDFFLLQYFGDALQVGYYAMPLQLVTLMVFPAGALGTAVAPVMAQMQEKGQNPGRLLLASIRYTLILFVPLATGLFVLARPFVRLFYGDSYLPSVPVLRIYMPFFVLFALSSVISLSLNFLGLAKQRARIVLGAALLKVLLAVIAIPLAGIVGAALVALASYVGVLSFYFALIVRHCGVHRRDLLELSWRALASAAAMAVAATLFRRIATTYVGFGIAALVSSVVFLVVFSVVGGVRRQDWEMLRTTLAQREQA